MNDEPLEFDMPFSAKVLRVLEGPFEEISVVEIQNRSKRIETLKPSRFQTSSDLWVFLSKSHLEPGEKTTAIISKKKES